MNNIHVINMHNNNINMQQCMAFKNQLYVANLKRNSSTTGNLMNLNIPTNYKTSCPIVVEESYKNINFKANSKPFITFSTENEALAYTKQIILEALKENKERMVFTRGAEILSIVDGDNSSVSIKSYNEIPIVSGFIHHHGHPGHPAKSSMPLTFPPSISDIMAFLYINENYGCEKAILYNSEGDTAIMTKKYTPKSNIPVTLELENQLKVLKTDFDNNNTIFDSVENVAKFCSSEEKEYVMKLLEKKYMNEFEEWINYKARVQSSHDWLKEFLPKLGIEYSTNFRHIFKN